VHTIHAGPNKTLQNTMGKDITGYEFQLDAQSENGYADLYHAYSAFKKQDYDYFTSAFYQDLHGLSNNYYAISYNPQNSSPQPTEFSLHYNSTVRGTEYRSRNQNTRRSHKRTQSGNMGQPTDEEYRIE
ncbi:hypothetical protein L9G15_21010, partial [Shewanella sp. A3A]|nr:hypothetical protein [Shewanella ferrihydritica]